MTNAIDHERTQLHKILVAIEKAENLAEFLKNQTDSEEAHSLLETLASQALTVKWQVKSLKRFDKAVERIGHKKIGVILHPQVEQAFEQGLADARRNEHHALAELHAVATVIHDLSRHQWDQERVRPAMSKLFVELRKLRRIVEEIEKDLNAELILFDG